MKIGFLVTVLVGKPFNTDCSGETFFARIYMFHYQFCFLEKLEKLSISF